MCFVDLFYESLTENEAEEVLSSSRPPAPPSSASPVPSSHSEHDSRVSSRDSPVNRSVSSAVTRVLRALLCNKGRK